MRLTPFIPLLTFTLLAAQGPTEGRQALSPAAQKGPLVDSALTSDGQLRATFQTPSGREDYLFDRATLAFKGQAPGAVATAESRPDRDLILLDAYVGGTNSFTVLSMKPKLVEQVWKQTWRPELGSWDSRLLETRPAGLKLEDRGYKAYANFPGEDGLLLVAMVEPKDGDEHFVVVHVDPKLQTKETAVPVKGEHELAHCGRLASGNIYLLMAPHEDAGDPKNYVYVEFNSRGDVALRGELTMPAPGTAILDSREAGGDLYFIGASLDFKNPYDDEFTSYAPIGTPGKDPTTGVPFSCFQGTKWSKAVYEAEFKQFHLIRVSKGRLVSAGTAPIKDFKGKVVAPPSQRKGKPYEGKGFDVQELAVSPSGEVLVAGQFVKRKMANSDGYMEIRYFEYVCMHFDAAGQLKAQYTAERRNDDAKSEKYPSRQAISFSPDGRTAAWEVMEAKGSGSWLGAFSRSYALSSLTGRQLFHGRYAPRLATINLEARILGEFRDIGQDGKQQVYSGPGSLTEPDGSARYYLTHDEDFRTLTVVKVPLK